MLTHLDPQRHYTPRRYLRQWFDHGVIVTDNDLNDRHTLDALLQNIPVQDRIIDITHNPYPDDWVTIDGGVRLTNNFEYWYKPIKGVRFFPLFIWAYSLRKNIVWHEDLFFDAGTNKTQGFMCLNNNHRPHRTRLHQLLSNSGSVPHIAYSIDGQGLPDETGSNGHNDVGIGHPVYDQTAVNIVTETSFDQTYLCEKTCKPFIAYQIPVIVAGPGSSQWLSDIGLDMFEDLVPWHTWDSEPDPDTRLQKIATFVEHWIKQGTVLQDYQRVLHRVKRNKQYFHSEAFRQRIMNQMSLDQ
jgi:hypothetical protein